jgi:sulfatase maturation enzyme AslB (radical SAM superfamily)
MVIKIQVFETLGEVNRRMKSSMKCSLGCSYCTITEKLQKYTDFKEELIRYMATEHGLYNTINTIHNGYYSKQIAQKLKTA